MLGSTHQSADARRAPRLPVNHAQLRESSKALLGQVYSEFEEVWPLWANLRRYTECMVYSDGLPDALVHASFLQV
jgi:hypothetical protein